MRFHLLPKKCEGGTDHIEKHDVLNRLLLMILYHVRKFSVMFLVAMARSYFPRAIPPPPLVVRFGPSGGGEFGATLRADERESSGGCRAHLHVALQWERRRRRVSGQPSSKINVQGDRGKQHFAPLLCSRTSLYGSPYFPGRRVEWRVLMCTLVVR